MTESVFRLGVALLLVLFNGFFVAAEFAIVKVRRTRLELLAGQGIKAARVSLLCVDQLDEYLSTTQLGITLVSLGLGWIGEEAFATVLTLLFPEVFPMGDLGHHLVASGIAFFVITALHVILGELVPKSMAIQNAETITLWIAKPLSIFHSISKPLILAFTATANAILRMIGYGAGEEEPLSEQELKLVMKESHEEGVISESEAQIITRAFEFSDKTANQIMVPSEKVDYISLARPLEQNLAVIRRNMHTRFPLCQTDFNSAIGIIHMKDIWPRLLVELSNDAFLKGSRPAIFVNSRMKQDHVLKLFQGRRGHMAIVQENDRRYVGIVTMEDILEELIGEIQDEHGN